MTSRRTILATIAGIPLAVTASLKPMGGGLWIHVEKLKKTSQHDFIHLGQFVRSKTNSKWLSHYTRKFDDRAMEGMWIRQFRQKAIDGNSMAVAFVRVPPQTVVRTNDLNTIAKVPMSYLYSADVITYQKTDGSIQFLKCRWQSPAKATAEFARA